MEQSGPRRCTDKGGPWLGELRWPDLGDVPNWNFFIFSKKCQPEKEPAIERLRASLPEWIPAWQAPAIIHFNS